MEKEKDDHKSQLLFTTKGAWIGLIAYLVLVVLIIVFCHPGIP